MKFILCLVVFMVDTLSAKSQYWEPSSTILGLHEGSYKIYVRAQGMRIWRMGRKHLNRGRRMQPVPIDELGLQFIKCFNLS